MKKTNKGKGRLGGTTFTPLSSRPLHQQSPWPPLATPCLQPPHHQPDKSQSQ